MKETWPTRINVLKILGHVCCLFSKLSLCKQSWDNTSVFIWGPVDVVCPGALRVNQTAFHSYRCYCWDEIQTAEIRKRSYLLLPPQKNPRCFCGCDIPSLILMLHFSLFEVYNDVVHLHVYKDIIRRDLICPSSGTENKPKKAFLSPDRRWCGIVPLMPCLGGLGQSDPHWLSPAVVLCGKHWVLLHAHSNPLRT